MSKEKCNHEWIWNKGSKVYYCHLCNGTAKKIKQEKLPPVKIIEIKS